MRFPNPLLPGSLAAAAAAFFLVWSPADASAQLNGGPQLTLGSDSGLGVGARITFPLQADYEWVDGAIDGSYASPGDADSWIETNLNVRIYFPLTQAFDSMVGTGLNASFVSVEDPGSPGTSTDTSFGVNVLGGVRYPREGVFNGRAFPYAELRAVLWGADQAVFSLGLLFGSPRQTMD